MKATDRSKRAKWSTLEQRLAWLRKHPELWESVKLRSMLPGMSYRLFAPKLAAVRIVNEMKKAGLLAPSTYYLDVKVGKYIRILRGLR